MFRSFFRNFRVKYAYMKATTLLGIGILGLGMPIAYGQTELEELQARCEDQERQINLLKEEIKTLKQAAQPAAEAAQPATEAAQPATEAAQPAEAPETYTVQAGDSFDKIAQRAGTTADAVAKANGLKKNSVIRPGQKLKLPSTGIPAKAKPVETEPAETTATEPSTSTAQIHKIVSGDNFAKIARKYGVTVADIVAANPKAKANSLQIGQEIKIPGGKTDTTGSKKEIRGKTEKHSAGDAAPVETNESSAEAPKKPAGNKVRTLTVEEETTFEQFATKHGTTTERLNELNGLDLAAETVLAKGSELYVPGQP